MKLREWILPVGVWVLYTMLDIALNLFSPQTLFTAAVSYAYLFFAPFVATYMTQRRLPNDIVNIQRYRQIGQALSKALNGRMKDVLKDTLFRGELATFLLEVLILLGLTNDLLAYSERYDPRLFMLAASYTVIIVPAIEEFFFRGYLFHGLIGEHLPPCRKEELLKPKSIVAISVSSALFGLSHLTSPFFSGTLDMFYVFGILLIIVPLAIINCVAYWWSKDLILPSLLHAVFNLIRLPYVLQGLHP